MHTPHGNRMGEFNILNALVVRNRHVLLRCVDLHTNPQVEPGRGKSHGGRPRFSKKPQRPRRRPLSRTGNQNAGGGGYLALRNSRETKPDQRRFPRGGLRENRVLLSVPPLPHTGARAAAGFFVRRDVGQQVQRAVRERVPQRVPESFHVAVAFSLKVGVH